MPSLEEQICRISSKCRALGCRGLLPVQHPHTPLPARNFLCPPQPGEREARASALFIGAQRWLAFVSSSARGLRGKGEKESGDPI